MVDKINAKIQLLLLLIYKNWCFFVMNSFAKQHTKKVTEVKKIAAFWYNPTNIPGSTERIGGWEKYFEADGYTFENFTTITNEERFKYIENGSWAERYRLIRKIYRIRLEQFKQLKVYDVAWIDRGFVPFDYDLQTAHFERAIKKMGVKIVVDSTDGGDIKRNPRLVKDTIKQADRITIGYKYIRELFEPVTSKPIIQVNYTLPVDGYIEKESCEIKGVPVLGWMGSPSNMQFLKSIEAPLQRLAKRKPFKLIVICRKPLKMEIPGAEVEYVKSFEHYFETLSRFDIGLCPFTREDESTKGKIAMKHQEFMICKIPQVCSPVAICDEIVHEKHALIAREIDDWDGALLRLIENEGLRSSIATESNQLFFDLFTYENEYPKLRDAIVL